FGVYANPSASAGASASTNADPSTRQFADPADVRAVLTVSFLVTPSTPTFTFFARFGTSASVNHLSPTYGEVKTSELNFGNSAYSLSSFPKTCRGRLARASSSRRCRNPARARWWRRKCCAWVASGGLGVRACAPELDHRRHHRDGDDREDHEREVVLHDRDRAEEIAGRDEQCDPGSAAGHA